MIIIDLELHKIAGRGFAEVVKTLDKLNKYSKAPAPFKPIPINKFVNPRPNWIWYLRRYEKTILSYSIMSLTIIMFIMYLIKNWR